MWWGVNVGSEEEAQPESVSEPTMYTVPAATSPGATLHGARAAHDQRGCAHRPAFASGTCGCVRLADAAVSGAQAHRQLDHKAHAEGSQKRHPQCVKAHKTHQQKEENEATRKKHGWPCEKRNTHAERVLLNQNSSLTGKTPAPSRCLLHLACSPVRTERPNRSPSVCMPIPGWGMLSLWSVCLGVVCCPPGSPLS